MNLAELIAAIDVAEVRGGTGVEITDLGYDSRRVEPGCLFFCVPGQQSDGHNFAPQALERGAVAMVVERPLDLPLPQLVVADARAAMAPVAARFFGNPSREVRIGAITGTNGKTTTAYMLRAILESSGISTGLIGTIKRVIGGADVDTVLTTPEAIDLQRNLRAMVDAGDRACAIEISSHALSLHRVDSIEYEVAAFTNLSREHLDFHHDMDAYFAAKRSLFVPSSGNPPRTSVVNIDDVYGQRLAADIDAVTYSLDDVADYSAVDVSFDASGARFRCRAADAEVAVTVPLPGEFNVHNALCALAMAGAMGVDLEPAAEALASVGRVPGRFQRIEEGQSFSVLIDYAHTPDSLERALRAVRAMTSGRVISVFGCRGDRDRTKRPLMGAIAARLADVFVATSDSPNSEQPDAIIDEIMAGVESERAAGRASADVVVEIDRGAAIGLALAEARDGDTVLVTGRGHEPEQTFSQGGRLAFDDRTVAREELRALASRGSGAGLNGSSAALRLGEIASALDSVELRGGGDAAIASLAYDSRRVGAGSLFFCVRGQNHDGHGFADEAVENGAVALVVDHPLDLDVPQLVVADTRAAMAPLAARFSGDPSSELDVIAITGTNGKTTTTFLTRSILEHAGIGTGQLGTVRKVIGGQESEVVRTTPEAIDLQVDFRAMLDAGDRACAMEVSSHALTLRRADSIHFAAAAFTNLTQDHLDFHADMEEYFLAKRKLFVETAGKRPRAAVVNADDAYGRRLAAEIDCVTFSAAGEAADFRAVDVRFDVSGSRFACEGPDGRVDIEIGLPGDFNVSNALAAIALASSMGVGLDDAAAALAAAESVPGRFEPITEGQPFSVLVDYAHTPDSLENVLRAARRVTSGRLICVFGCGGDRDREKRPLMGAVVARLADLTVVTSDNPRSEDPETIIEEILAGIPAVPGDGELVVDPDRRAAIASALAAAEPTDLVLIAGKGHERGQEFERGRKVPFDDRVVAREELRRLIAQPAAPA